MSAPRVRTALLGVVLLAVALRVPTLGEQSLWADEAATVDVLDRSFGDLFGAIRDQESTPPLFYVLAWVVAQVAGLGEAAVRIVPALCGIATVPVVAALGARLGGPRAAVAAALLVATSPLLVWFSQEARAYALLVLLTAASVLLLLRARETPSSGRLLAWGAVVGLAFAAHPFALFLAVGETAWLALALRARDAARAPRRLATALALPVASGLALLGLILDQRAADRASFIAEEPLGERVAQVPKQFLVGYDGPAEVVLTALAAALAVAALVALAVAVRRRTPPPDAPDADAVVPLAAITAAALLVPLALAAVGDDYVITRNLLPALVPGLVLVAAGAAVLPRTVGPVVVGLLALTGGGVAVAVQVDPDFQREDWRAAIGSVGDPAAGGPRLVVVDPGSGRPAALRYLGRGTRVAPDDPAAIVPVREVAVVVVAERGEDGDRAAERVRRVTALPGFVRVGITRGDRWASVRFVAPAVTGALVGSAGSGLPDTLALVEP